MKARVVLLVPIKPLSRAKTRLRASAPSGGRSLAEHMDLVLAMAVDTVVAARGAAGVAGVAAITSDRRVITAMTELGVETILEPGQLGLNDALDLGSRTVRATRPEVQIGALNADLPSLCPAELSAALRLAAGRHAFCRDRAGTGTTLLLAGRGQDLDPRFGPWSASAHLTSGATELSGPWPSLRCDVDTESDLAVASSIGLGAQTRWRLAALAQSQGQTGS
ncbi:2-phospho-L-lactate guanylyltransferase [Nocardioides sp. AN3]